MLWRGGVHVGGRQERGLQRPPRNGNAAPGKALGGSRPALAVVGVRKHEDAPNAAP